MADHIIEVRIDDKIATVVGDPLYVCGNSDYIVKFAFDAEWADHAMKTARFIKSNKEYIDVVFNGNECPMPIIADTPHVRIGVFAGNLCTTTAAIVNAQRSILCGSGVPAEPDPDVYSQIMERIDNLNIADRAEYSQMITDQINALNIPDLSERVDALQSNAVIAQHVRGDTLHIEDAAAWRAEKVVTHIEPTQGGSGDPSPDNIRPINGWTQANLRRESDGHVDVYTAQFGQTVYGGSYDWDSGKFIATWACKVMTKGSDLIWNSAQVCSINTADNLAAYGNVEFMLSHYKCGKWNSAYPNNYAYQANGEMIMLRDEAHFTTRETAAEYILSQAAAGTPLTLAYKLATPIEIQLAPQQMPEMLKGVNNVWCDAGETEMVYIADNQLYIDQKIGGSTAALNAIMEGINNV